ncbi:major facilitator superfamily domain-containing protein [Dendryphion nanum]|uniref:Major facilitator superfamily domain-containing protein n=1 Tax=Dendryphion nanum TaxID=256645 RepID=A0A9P9IFA9_9PLEO|nr:major facilitator superfamily domain-containing protein [Dendryphion nanum]
MSSSKSPATSDSKPSISSEASSKIGTRSSSKKFSGHSEYSHLEQNDIHSSSSGDEEIESPSGRHRHRRDLVLNTNIEAGAAVPLVDEPEQADASKQKPISWRQLPRKDQLLILTLSRLSEPLTQTSLGSYIFYQLEFFDPTLPASTISYQAGIIHAAFPAAQFLTAILWGRFADSEHGGRKRVIWIGLFGSMLSMLGFGFSRSFHVAVFWRCVGGILNGNIGVMRTMISEIIKEKKYQSRAFLILPMTFNVGVIIGPILGGLLADPAGSYPSIFGPGSRIGGKNGIGWMLKWPYALPNLVNAIFLLFAACSVIFFLEETSELSKHKPDPGLRIGRLIRRFILRENISEGYMPIPTDDARVTDVELQQTPTSVHIPAGAFDKPINRNKLPFRRIWTRNLIVTFISHGLLAMHVGTFNSLWFIYLSAPRFDPRHPHPPNYKPHGFIHFTGGLALPPPRIGLALAILGVIGITLQLFLYPRLSHRLGTARAYRIFLTFFPLTYALLPFLSIVPSWSSPPDGVSGPFVWSAITAVLFVQVIARTFALPCGTILVNNCSPHPSVLGTVHGCGQSVSSLTRTFGPIMFGWIFGKGLDMGVVGLAWWILAIVAIVGSIAGRFLYEGDGHEILLEGEIKGEDGVVRRED